MIGRVENGEWRDGWGSKGKAREREGEISFSSLLGRPGRIEGRGTEAPHPAELSDGSIRILAARAIAVGRSSPSSPLHHHHTTSAAITIKVMICISSLNYSTTEAWRVQSCLWLRLHNARLRRRLVRAAAALSGDTNSQGALSIQTDPSIPPVVTPPVRCFYIRHLLTRTTSHLTASPLG